nr:amorpha-4,11-diene C-12 oxidase [Tanacetum cinerariifolium]
MKSILKAMALSLTTSIALATILFFVYKFATRSKSTKNSLPEPWRLPIIGHMHHLIGTIPHRGVMDLARKYGSLMHLQLGEVSTIVVSSPKWAKEILTTYDITFANRPETLTGEIVAYHNTDIVLAPYGEYWRQLRKLCTLELLSVKKVKSFQSLREEECWNLVQEIKASGSGRPVNLSENIFKLIATILSRAAFGKGIRDQKEFTEIVKEILRQTGGFDVADIFPSKKFLHHLSGKRARLKDSAEFPLTADNVKAIILDMFGAGTDTSSATIEWAISELIKCPRAMEKVQVELRKALNGKERIHEEDIQELSYLNLVIKETLRDPEYWKDAETFIPERFENSSTTVMGAEYEYLPFGAGRRMCPGAALGLANVQLPLANILYHFNWKLPNGASYDQIDMTESFGATVQRKTELLLVPSF